MRIHRSSHTEDSASLPLALLREDRLSFLARGILCDLLTRPDDGRDATTEDIYQAARAARGDQAEGRGAIRAAFAELERCGYLVRRRAQSTNGQFMTFTDLYDTPGHQASAASGYPAGRPRLRGEYLYRHWDADGILLYVGVTQSPRRRERGHATTSRWMELKATTTIEEHPSRAAVEAAEAVAINTERPLFNVAGNENPQARQRLWDYLSARNRLDLLPPDAYAHAR